MSTARICVDYLSHEWYPNDLIQTHREIRRQVRSSRSSDSNSNNSSASDRYRLARFENALWRQMGRTLTDRLGKHNPMVDPAAVDWQKESDITWLYGPMYVIDNDTSAPAPSLLPHTRRRQQRRKPRQPHGSPPRSVRFDPNIIQYSPPPEPTPPPPPRPVYAYIDSDDEHDDDADDDVVGKLFVDMGQSIQSYIFPKQQGPKSLVVAEFSVVCAAAAFLRSVASVLATWVMYKSLGRLIRRTWQIRWRGEGREEEQHQPPRFTRKIHPATTAAIASRE